jgi:hypothetical protein
MNTYLMIYMAIGLVLAIAMFIYQYQSSSNFSRELTEVLYGKKPWHYRLREKLVIPCTIVLIAICWPLALVLLVKDVIPERKSKKEIEIEYPFIARPENLIGEKSVIDIEKENVYVDPLQRVPNIPFGHLNSGWMAFKSQITSEDSLQLFKTPKGSSYGRYGELLTGDVSGYALVRSGEIIAEFISEDY